MSIHSAVGGSQRASQLNNQAFVFPAPVRGMDGTSALSINDLSISLYNENIVPSQYGLKVRPGTREWQAGVGSEVRTVIPYTGESSDRSDDRVFVASQDGIYDVTADGGIPASKFTFADQTEDAGFGNYAHYVDGGGIDRLFYADARNGLFEYDKLTDTWAQATGITEAVGSINIFDVEAIVYIVVHKLRMWLVPRDASYSWYLPILSTTGDAEEFFFGAKFRHGGELVGLYNWTIDAGDGVDDKLVAVSRAGDIIPYQGDDPSLATWQNIGTYFIGAVPKGNRICSEYGGNLFMLSTFGITSMADLVMGQEALDINKSSIGLKISRFLRDDMKQYKDVDGWDIKFVTQEGQLVVISPQRNDGIYRQYSYNLSTQGWGTWANVPMLSADPWLGELMVGTKDGRILRMDTTVDNVNNDGSGGNAITWYVLTSYSDLEQPGLYKRAVEIRPSFLADTEPAYQCYALYDYDTTRPAAVPPIANLTGALWDTGLWSQAFWQTDSLSAFSAMQGANGVGRTIAIAMTGESFTETNLGAWDIAWNTGGFR